MKKSDKMAKINNSFVRVLAVYEILLSANKPLSASQIVMKLEQDYNINAECKAIYGYVRAINMIFPIEYIKNQGYISIYIKERNGGNYK